MSEQDTNIEPQEIEAVPGETQETSTNDDDFKAKYEAEVEARKRAERALAKTKKDKHEVESQKEEVKSESNDKIDFLMREVLVSRLEKHKITEPEAIEYALEYSKKTGESIDAVIKDGFIMDKISSINNTKKLEKKGDTQNPGTGNSVDYFVKKGIVPERGNPLRQEVIDKMLSN